MVCFNSSFPFSFQRSVKSDVSSIYEHDFFLHSQYTKSLLIFSKCVAQLPVSVIVALSYSDLNSAFQKELPNDALFILHLAATGSGLTSPSQSMALSSDGQMSLIQLRQKIPVLRLTLIYVQEYLLCQDFWWPGAILWPSSRIHYLVHL